MPHRYLPQTSPLLTLSPTSTLTYLTNALEDIISNFPPRNRYPSEFLHGLWSGPTGIAYLLLQVSSRKPELTIAGRTVKDWARAYIGSTPASRGHNLRLGSHGCGIGDERLAYEAVRCSVFAGEDSDTDRQNVKTFVRSVMQIMDAVSEYPDELLYGRAGTLYLLRMVRTWVSGCDDLIGPAIVEVENAMLGNAPNWKWRGKRYLGAAHGDIGIVTQLVLTSPELAPRLEDTLSRLLEMQREDGNWPSSEEAASLGGGKGLVQFCHGAPGFVTSLLSLREFFPNLHDKIDAAVERGRECIWQQGLLKKEPCLCHGIFGNALTLARGEKRDHFLAVAVPENVARLKAQDPTVFERADYGRSYSLTTSYTPSAVWTWLVAGDESPSILAYNDI
ncbi:uncharacterized protein CTHT_0040020 [Thermochaetoides thermophila DSM 1495]|uniref:Uncharacterized protein n=1 Tax=Chaetomium thermophilum (strain DSM 1495 / CBS 144.50 / IMI 039719) TaxID=759272 RepID=G0S8R0_CHATD|nr:hypothetical protein CTHT_0040020 [Thermochaetoides thermophila DSM 1495]EGS20263.1 hypothetical protein CTHT_0040020 [Thermochaetoides thermophila DSM 1495]